MKIVLGLYLWLIVYPMGAPIGAMWKNATLERTWWEFDSMEDCEEFGNNSYYIHHWLYNNPGTDWIMALCFDPEDAERTYILPVYRVGDPPDEALSGIETFEETLVNKIIPEIFGIPIDQVPKKKIIIKSKLD